jgi:hypothetical protein
MKALVFNPSLFAALCLLALASPTVTSQAAPLSCRDFLVKAKSWMLGRPDPRPSGYRVSSPMIELLDQHALTDPEVVRLFVRQMDKPVKSEHYLQNISDSIREGFAPWFEKAAPGSYVEMLKLQHVILTMGLDGSHPYLSTSMSQPLSSGSRGRLRYELSSLFMSPYLQYHISDYFNLSALHPAFKEFLEVGRPGSSYLVAIDGIDEPHRPVMELRTLNLAQGIQNYSVRYRYPPNPGTRFYVEELEKKMESLRALPASEGSPVTGKVPSADLLNLLADYVQLFSAGLPFDRVNYSMAMAQVNYILMKHGMRGIEHGDLDLIAVVVPTRVFRQVFSDAVKAGQH